MSKLSTPGHCRIAIQICAMTAVAALMSGCSADSSRFGDAFGNPFTTGSVHKPKKVAHATPSMGTGRTPPVTASALPPRGQLASAVPVHPAPVAVSHETTGSIGPARAVPGASFGGWTGQGGASIQVGQGDTAAKLAERYGVPLNVLLQVNGLRSAAELQPGATVVVPIYNAVATAPGGARVAQAPMRSEPVEPAEPPRAEAPRAVPARAARPEVARAEPEEPARKAPGLPFKVADKPQTLAERNAEAQRIVATQRAADKLAADKLAAEKASSAQKAAEMERVAALRKAAAAAAAAEAEKTKLAKAEAAHKVGAKDAASRAEAKQAALAEKQAAAQKLAADKEAAKAKAEAAKSAAAAAKAAKLAAAPAAPAQAKPEQVAAVDRKAVDTTATASVPAAAPAAEAPAPVAAESGGPEFRWPAHGRIIQGFKGGAGGNDGINIAVPEGTAVKAAEGGVVAYAGNELKGYGNLVLIRHPNGYVTAYANNGEIDVKRGETVKRGQMIAKSGQSGNVSSPQLHFEVRKGSTPIDPTGFLAGT